MSSNVTLEYQKKYNDILHNINAEVISYGISSEYIPNWKEENALVEYVANFYDENGENFTISYEKTAVILEDKSERGIKIEDLAFGNSNSSHYTYKIGTFGEGFKLGALVLIRNQKKVYIETIGKTIIFYLEKDDALNSSILKSKIIPNERRLGTLIYLETNENESFKEKFIFLNKNLNKINDFLYKPLKEDKKNYVYINTLASQEINSQFSYLLRKKEKINRDRNMLQKPYESIAIEILSSKDENMLKEWLLCLTNKNFENSFEHEMIKYINDNYNKSKFKQLDTSVFKKVAKDLNLLFVSHSFSEWSAYLQEVNRLDKNLIFSNDKNLYKFCERMFHNITSLSLLDALIKKSDFEFEVPLLLSNKLTDEGHALNVITLLKIMSSKFDCENDEYVLSMNKRKNEIKIHSFGHNAEKHVSIYHSVIYLLENKYISIDGWDIKKINSRLYMSLPNNSVKVTVYNEKLKKVFNDNLSFINVKVIIEDLVYLYSGKQQYLLDNGIQLNEIDAIYSYEFEDSYDVTTMFQERQYAYKILAEAKKGNLPSFENNLIYELINSLKSISKFNIDDYDFRQTKRTLSETFTRIYGNKSCISDNSKSDKLAVYNGYEIVNVEPSIKELFTFLRIHTSSNVKNIIEHKYDIIQKPNVSDKSLNIKKTPYYKIFAILTLLNKVLEKLYQANKHCSRSLHEMNALFPYNETNALVRYGIKQRDYHLNLGEKSFKKVLLPYCFEVYEHTFLTNHLGSNGLNHNEYIYIEERNESIIGTFFHEYIHFSTNLIDIDQKFEIMLSFLSIMASTVTVSNEDVDNFINDYKKWSKK